MLLILFSPFLSEQNYISITCPVFGVHRKLSGLDGIRDTMFEAGLDENLKSPTFTFGCGFAYRIGNGLIDQVRQISSEIKVSRSGAGSLVITVPTAEAASLESQICNFLNSRMCGSGGGAGKTRTDIHNFILGMGMPLGGTRDDTLRALDKIADKLFASADKDDDNIISDSEFSSALSSLGIQTKNGELDERGKLEFANKMFSSISNPVLDQTKKVLAAFLTYDKDKNGKINQEEFKNFLKTLSKANLENEDCDRIFKECAGSQEIDIKLMFKALSLSIPKKQKADPKDQDFNKDIIDNKLSNLHFGLKLANTQIVA